MAPANVCQDYSVILTNETNRMADNRINPKTIVQTRYNIFLAQLTLYISALGMVLENKFFFMATASEAAAATTNKSRAIIHTRILAPFARTKHV